MDKGRIPQGMRPFYCLVAYAITSSIGRIGAGSIRNFLKESGSRLIFPALLHLSRDDSGRHRNNPCPNSLVPW